jgi:hypothetical protein
MNPLGKLGNKIKYLTPDEQKYVIDNVQPEGVDISKLTESIQNFKQNKLTSEFIHGLFDGDGGLSVFFVKSSSSVRSQSTEGPPKLSVGFSFIPPRGLLHDQTLLNDIKMFWQENYPPVKIYQNVTTEKAKILKENTGLAGVYLWTNINNYKRYVGSGTNLSNRLSLYFTSSKMDSVLKRSRSHILSAILKHGISNFTLSILEYCDPEKAISREDYWIETLRPEYNILQKAGSSFGFRHSPETIQKMSELQNLIKHRNPGLFKKGHKKIEGAGKLSKRVEVLDIDTSKRTIYNTISAAAEALNINQAAISMYFVRNQKRPFRGRYIFTKVD